MKKLTAAILACGILASGVFSASASMTMRYSVDGGTTWTNVADDGVLDQVSGLGFLSYTGNAGVWSLNTLVAFGSPILGYPNAPLMDIGTTVSSSSGGTLIVQLSDTNFVGAPNQTFIGQSGGFAGGTATYTAYRDFGNVLFGTTSTYSGDPAGVSPSATASVLYNVGPATGNYQSSNSVVAPNAATPYSVTLQIVIVHNSAIDSHTDSSIWALPPPPCNCTLTFNSPAAITNCADETIPDVTASQDCGAGAVSVPVTFVSATTNGSCPQIITRNYTATDDCGAVHPFTQTVTVNCKPDCTITPSVTTAMVGGSNYTASVANAGAGATYSWTILNGSITGGQGTTKITWSAGSDTNSPISIVVVVTAPTGCQSTCSASVKLTPQPPKISLGHGDTATIGFWNNKNGQGLILGASNSPALANWLASNFPCLYGATSANNLTGKPNSTVASLFQTFFGVKGAKSDAQVMAGALACYFTSTSLGGGSGPTKFGFNQSPGGTGDKTFNIGSNGTILGLQNNTSYTILQLLQAASNAKCNPTIDQKALAAALNTIFDAINQGGDIS
jgi:hypothetical protein